jgi:hypothetical protein
MLKKAARATLFRTMREFKEIDERPEGRIDGIIVRNVVTIVLTGRFLKRHQPDRRKSVASSKWALV